MVGKIKSNKFLSSSQIAALMGDSKFTTPNTLLTDILAKRKVKGFVVTQVEQKKAMEFGAFYLIQQRQGSTQIRKTRLN